jgi:hypothetical protein
MLKAIEGIYRDGKVELLETPEDMEEARVIVTFFPSVGPVDLQARGIDAAQAAELRARLQAFAEDWERPEMAAYDALEAGRGRAGPVSRLQPSHCQAPAGIDRSGRRRTDG